MNNTLLINALVATAERVASGAIAISDGRISAVRFDDQTDTPVLSTEGYTVIDLEGKVVFAGGIDAHTHFREPGMTHKGDLESESKAALLGGVTSFVDMPNTAPPTTSETALKDKLKMAQGRCWANYGFHIGATNVNLAEIKQILREDPSLFGGIKVFMGSSTGNMLVDSSSALEEAFKITNCPVLIHSESESRIRANLAEWEGKEIPFRAHPQIRDSRACILSTIKALEMAVTNGTALHVLHVSTKEELQMIRASKIHNPAISCESSANYLWFSDNDYERLGARIKCNPAIKEEEDRKALVEALKDGLIDTIGSDHAPHLLFEKDAPYRKCPSGIPSIAHQLPALLTLAMKEEIPFERIASAFSEKPAEIFGLSDRGRIAPGCIADLVVVELCDGYSVPEEVPYKCGWSPYAGENFSARIDSVYLAGIKCAENGKTIGLPSGKQLIFRK